MVRRNPSSGCLYLVMVPSEADQDAFLTAVRRVPVLEGGAQTVNLGGGKNDGLRGSKVKLILAVVASDHTQVGVEPPSSTRPARSRGRNWPCSSPKCWVPRSTICTMEFWWWCSIKGREEELPGR